MAAWMLALWPGARAAWHGSWRGLVAASAFAVVLNAVVLWSWLWREFPVDSSFGRGIAWSAVAVGWMVGIVYAMRPGDQSRQTDAEDLFPIALGEYLRGDWLSAEAAFRRIIATTPDDIASRLYLAGVLRRTSRASEAVRLLRETARFEHAEAWKDETRRELAAAHAEANAKTDHAAASNVGRPSPGAEDVEPISKEDSEETKVAGAFGE